MTGGSAFNTDQRRRRWLYELTPVSNEISHPVVIKISDLIQCLFLLRDTKEISMASLYESIMNLYKKEDKSFLCISYTETREGKDT